MKTTLKLFLAGIMALFCCSIARAQTILPYTGLLNYTNALSGGTLIYSNSFTGGTNSINGVTPTYINPNANYYGGSLSATFLSGTNLFTNNAYATQNGLMGGHDEGVYLPFWPTNGYIYNFSMTLTWNATPPAGDWDAVGYDTLITTNTFTTYSDPRPSSEGGNPWSLLNMFANGQGAIFYKSPSTPINSVPNLMTQLNFPYVINLVLDTTTTNWTAMEFVGGTPIWAFTYTNGTHAPIASFGYGQTTSVAGDSQWGPLTLSAVALAIVQQPASVSLSEGTTFTNAVVAGGQSPFAYQWYTNGSAIANATNASLIFSSVTNSDANTDYYCVVTNASGSVTSAPASLVVYTAPKILSANPITYTNLMTLFGGSGNNLGSSPTFSVEAGGLGPLTYYWQTNGVGAAVTAVNGFNTFTYTNCQMNSPTTYACIVSNSVGTVTNTWQVQYIPTPTAPYPQLIISNGPVAYWRLDETNYDSQQYNNGQICQDYMSGNNGVYTNVELYQPGYFVVSNSVPLTNDPTETSCQFGPADFTTGDNVNSVGTNVDFSAESTAEFSVSCWVNGGPNGLGGLNGAEPVNGGIVVKGTFGNEEYGLDDGGSGGAVRFFIRTAGNSVVAASSTINVGGVNQWYHLVGVCDESNKFVSLYINGLLAAQTAVATNAGVLPLAAGVPISIGENLLPGEVDGGHQFNGAIDDVAIFGKALNALQVNALWQTADGINPLTFTVPLAPTNQVWRQGQTFTISANALGTPQLGYYWTNITAGGLALTPANGVKVGTNTSLVSTITCTLTITNAGSNWDPDQLELVVTNASALTNMVFNLFAYPPPITIGYTNAFLYSNEFNGGTWNLNGTAPTEVNYLVGGTNQTWTDVLGTNDTAGQNGTTPGEIFGNGLDNCIGDVGNSWIFPFTPEPGFVYTETATETYSAAPGNWTGEGFGSNYVKNTTFARFDDGPASPDGMDWIILQSANGNVEFIDGFDNLFVTNANGLYTSGAGTNTMVVILDTTQPQWSQTAYVNGTYCGTGIWTNGNPIIKSVGITQNGVLSAPNDITWDSWSLTAVSPNGFPPYLLAAPSTNIITLTSAPVTITNLTGYGTGPWGYSWINNSTVVASGTTNATAPNATLINVPSSSLSVGTLDLVMTNALGTNTTVFSVVQGYPTSLTNITATVTNGTLYLSWPPSYTGAQLQSLTNPLTVGVFTNKPIGNNWANYYLSTTATNLVAIPIDKNNGTVFYRIVH